MAVVIVIPIHESLCPGAGVFDSGEMLRVVRRVFRGFKPRFAVRVVIGNARPIARDGDAQFGEK